jgi:hypothetical protein
VLPPLCYITLFKPFLFDLQLPLALAVVLDPAMQRDRLYSTSRRSALMLCISAGYFLHVSLRLCSCYAWILLTMLKPG